MGFIYETWKAPSLEGQYCPIWVKEEERLPCTSPDSEIGLLCTVQLDERPSDIQKVCNESYVRHKDTELREYQSEIQSNATSGTLDLPYLIHII